MKKSLATIVIPVHLEEPSDLEKISLTQTLTVLHKYPITFIAPEGLDTSWYEEFCRGKATVHVERFVWKGHQQFCELMVSAAFYERFLPYEYMMICHLDAFVFRDELEEWCKSDYDYIGSVVYDPRWNHTRTLLRKLMGFKKYPEHFGNGGFALKKVSAFYNLISTHKLYLGFYQWFRKLRKNIFLDDIFVAVHFPYLSPEFKIPPTAVARRFGAEYAVWDEKELPFNRDDKSSLPFGVHGWIQFHQDYWKPAIRAYGYAL